MEPMKQDAFKAMDWDFSTGVAGDWSAERPVLLILHTNVFDGLVGKDYEFDSGHLLLGKGYEWDGSSVVKDTDACRLASGFHDATYDAIARAHGFTWLWRLILRLIADVLYARICYVNGMSLLRAVGRFIGLRIGGGWVIVTKTLKGRTANGE